MLRNRRLSHRAVTSLLESRRLLAFSSLASDGILNIVGTAGDDAFTLAINGTDLVVTLNATDEAHPLADVLGIHAQLDDGHDSFLVTGNIDIPMSLHGGAGNDTLVGGDGDDLLYPGLGSDSLNGGAGNDEVTYASRSTPVTGSLIAEVTADMGMPPFFVRTTGTVTATGGESDSLLDIETLTGGDGNDTLSISAATDGNWAFVSDERRTPLRINGMGGSDTLSIATSFSGLSAQNTVPMTADGGAGNDNLSTSIAPTNGLFIGGEGDDHFYHGDDDSLPPSVQAGPGFDTYTLQRGLAYNYTIPLGLERIEVSVIFQTMSITGNAERNEIVVNTSGPISVKGLGGNDDIRVSSSNHGAVIDGGDGDDYIVGSAQDDSLRGGDGADTILAGDGADKVWGGEGNDRLYGEGGKDLIRGEGGNDRLAGGGHSDKLYGGDGTDRLYGQLGNDTLEGEGGRDYLFGGEGRDTATRQKTDHLIDSIEILL